MKNLAIMLLTLLALCSCSNLDPMDMSNSGNYYDPEDFISEQFFLPLMDGTDLANIYGMANGYNTISVIASGCMFEVSCLPPDMFLAPFPGGSVYAEDGHISMLRDVIPYTHEEFCNSEVSNQPRKYQLSFPEHSMTYKVKQGESVHTVCITFGQTDGVTEFSVVGGHYYWVYLFTMEITAITVDGEEQPLPTQRTIEYKLYFNRYKDSI